MSLFNKAKVEEKWKKHGIKVYDRQCDDTTQRFSGNTQNSLSRLGQNALGFGNNLLRSVKKMDEEAGKHFKIKF